MRKLDCYPELFPEPWASDWGQDAMGLWMAFTYQGVRQAFRWIEPGTFQMGSPEHEAERRNDERLHTVTLNRGFWLADTTVTQALWQAVMGRNPSKFKGENRPVETISWDDAHSFIETLNKLKPDLKLCLPSEAQWEYAGRAGSSTPFSFGEQIDSSLVNFNGNYPYHKGKVSEYREQTVDVKSLPANAWGLYEMHGNVWEWCRDWYGDYPTEAVTDPQGPESGVNRVLRGGSWVSRGGAWRSAFRRGNVPSSSYGIIGFRLARGH